MHCLSGDLLSFVMPVSDVHSPVAGRHISCGNRERGRAGRALAGPNGVEETVGFEQAQRFAFELTKGVPISQWDGVAATCDQSLYALAAGETITGMIVATTLVYPDKKLASVKPKSVIKRMKEKKFAASVRRENIMECENIGIPLPEFVEICIGAMREISNEIGL